MNQKSHVKAIGTSKLVQLIVTVCFDIAFFLVLFLNEDLRNNIFANKPLTFLCLSIWMTMLCFLVFIFLDLFFIRHLTMESHELSKKAYWDRLTNVPNRQSLDMLFETHNTPEAIADMGCAMLRISNLAETNHTQGKDKGDELLQGFCKFLDEMSDAYDFFGRNGGNEFILVIENCTDTSYGKFLDTLQAQILNYNKENAQTPIEVMMAFTRNSIEHISELNQLYAFTSKRLYTGNAITIPVPVHPKEDTTHERT